MNDTVWEAINNNLIKWVQIGVGLTASTYRVGEIRQGDQRVETLEAGLVEAEEAIGIVNLRRLLNGEKWVRQMEELSAQRQRTQHEVDRLDSLLIIIGERQNGAHWERGGNGWTGDDDPPTYSNPSITLTDDQVSTVKEHT